MNRGDGKTGYCAAHIEVWNYRERTRKADNKKHRLATDEQERERYEFYKSKTWRKLRKLQLASEPLCRLCKRPARVVDHIVQISLGGERYDMDNLQSLCDRCHNIKRGEESKAAMKRKKDLDTDTPNEIK
jgi:5-methylcytosine-specific restriction protein A